MKCLKCGCVIEAEEVVCSDCGITDPSMETVISVDKVYATQGGGFVKWDDEIFAYLFVEAPPNYEVGDEMPEEWGIAPTVTGKPVIRCFVCGNEYLETRERYNMWGNSGYPFDPADWECPSCREMMSQLEEYYEERYNA